MNEATATEASDRTVRVRVWFGRFPIVDYTTHERAAPMQAVGLGRRFSGLRVTIEPDDSGTGIVGAVR
ncbi:hypothetical protein ACIBL3_39135 [Kribbella sp. NPDC050124]|uniref:hypothetical protein n=1 Tax=Kribbella sp. NPDC050124 TaxID=3364114 RepID=UPI0037BD08DD